MINLTNYIELPPDYKFDNETVTDDTLKFNIVQGDKTIYTLTLMYGIFGGHKALYIEDIARLVILPPEYKEYKIGSIIIDGIAEFAEECGYKYVGTNPVAYNSIEGASEHETLDQNQLEAWYIRHMSNRQFDFRFYSCYDEFISERMI